MGNEGVGFEADGEESETKREHRKKQKKKKTWFMIVDSIISWCIRAELKAPTLVKTLGLDYWMQIRNKTKQNRVYASTAVLNVD